MRLAPGRELELEGRGREVPPRLPLLVCESGIAAADSADDSAKAAAPGPSSSSSGQAASSVDSPSRQGRRGRSLPLGDRRCGAVGQDGGALVAGACFFFLKAKGIGGRRMRSTATAMTTAKKMPPLAPRSPLIAP